MHQAQWSPERPLPPPVSLASQSHHEKPPEVTCTSRGNPGFPASTRERPRETFFNTSRGQIPLPWLGSNDALPHATRMETRPPWRPTRGSLTSPSYLVRDRALGPPLENHPGTPPSSRRGGPSSPASPSDQSRDLSPNASGGLTPLSPPSELPEIHVATRGQSRLLCLPSG